MQLAIGVVIALLAATLVVGFKYLAVAGATALISCVVFTAYNLLKKWGLL